MAIALQANEVGSVVTVDLSYGGTLWTAGILDRVLASQVEAGKTGLVRVVQGS